MPGIRDHVRAMTGYTPGEQPDAPDVVKLNTNENPYPPSPRVLDAIRDALTGDRLRKYPQPLGAAFRRAAGEVLGVDPDGVVVGNGSDDILTVLTRAFVPAGGRVASPTPSYVLYRTLADIQGAEFRGVPFTADWALPWPWPEPDADLTFLANPNSPSGTVLPASAVERLAAALASFLVVDEAYADFAERHCAALVGRVPRLVVTRTMSKYYALAGMRFGFAVTDPATARELVKVKDSYNCDVLSLAAAEAAIRDQAYYADCRAKVVATRGRLAVALDRLGFRVTPSQANFLWCRRSDRPVRPISDELKRRNVLVRYMSYPAYGDGLRVSVGTDAEVDRLLDALRAAL